MLGNINEQLNIKSDFCEKSEKMLKVKFTNFKYKDYESDMKESCNLWIFTFKNSFYTYKFFYYIIIQS